MTDNREAKLRARRQMTTVADQLTGQFYSIDIGVDDKTVEAFGHITADGKLQFDSFVESEPNSPNSGHGHVRPRPDGVKARCGGPMMCHICAQELVQNMDIPTSTKDC